MEHYGSIACYPTKGVPLLPYKLLPYIVRYPTKLLPYICYPVTLQICYRLVGFRLDLVGFLLDLVSVLIDLVSFLLDLVGFHLDWI